MAEVNILIDGYAKQINGGWLASSTTTFIVDSGKRILVDPGANRELLTKRLSAEGLTVKEIDIVFLSHYHPDHALLAGMFADSIIMDGTTVYERDSETEYFDRIPETEIEVVLTPGHVDEHASLVVKTENGIVVVAADVFWWSEDEKQQTEDVDSLINREDPFMKNFAELRKSRKKVLEIANWVIPGHGKMFAVFRATG